MVVMERDWGRVLAPMLMNRSASMHAACSGPRCHNDGWPVPGTGYEAGQMQHSARLDKWHKAQATAFWMFTPQPQCTGTPGPPRNFPQTDSVTTVLDQRLPSESWLLFISCSLSLLGSNALQLWWRTERKILSPRSHGEAHSRTESCNTDGVDTRSL